jgi:hypothetical protein
MRRAPLFAPHGCGRGRDSTHPLHPPYGSVRVPLYLGCLETKRRRQVGSRRGCRSQRTPERFIRFQVRRRRWLRWMSCAWQSRVNRVRKVDRLSRFSVEAADVMQLVALAKSLAGHAASRLPIYGVSGNSNTTEIEAKGRTRPNRRVFGEAKSDARSGW